MKKRIIRVKTLRTITIDKGLEVFGYQHQGGWEAAPEDYDEDDDEVDDDEEDNWYDNSEHVFNGDGVTVQNKGGELDITVNGGLSAVDGTAVIMDVPYYWMDSQDDTTSGITDLVIDGNVTARDGLDINNLDNTTTVEITGDLKASANGARVITETGTAAVAVTVRSRWISAEALLRAKNTLRWCKTSVMRAVSPE